MAKTIYIPKGQECRFDSLTCGRVVVDGSLHVSGSLRARHISGKGFVYGKRITASTVAAHTVEAETIAADAVIAAHIAAADIRATRSVTAATLVTAARVMTPHIAYADAEISDLRADEAVKLKPKRRGLFRTLLASCVRSKWAALTSGSAAKETGSHGDSGRADERCLPLPYHGIYADPFSALSDADETAPPHYDDNGIDLGSFGAPDDQEETPIPDSGTNPVPLVVATDQNEAPRFMGDPTHADNGINPVPSDALTDQDETPRLLCNPTHNDNGIAPVPFDAPTDTANTPRLLCNPTRPDSCAAPNPSATPPDLEEAARLLEDPEFQRLRALWTITRTTGDIWMLAPKPEPTDRAVIAFPAA